MHGDVLCNINLSIAQGEDGLLRLLAAGRRLQATKTVRRSIDTNILLLKKHNTEHTRKLKKGASIPRLPDRWLQTGPVKLDARSCHVHASCLAKAGMT